ncbi:hypothetical protein DXA95_09025 [Odoribacter sp. OF09-27XD]|nr:hypothetical protein DXA95_09025 [Odoribacter sp. OF09-27XD]
MKTFFQYTEIHINTKRLFEQKNKDRQLKLMPDNFKETISKAKKESKRPRPSLRLTCEDVNFKT